MDQTLNLTAPAATPKLSAKAGLVLLSVFLVLGAFLAPSAPFIIDGGIYYDMARMMADEGSLAIAGNGGVEGAAPLTKHLAHAYNGAVYPQYPGGYALLAAPFYKLFGIHGLMLMNALSTLASLWLTYAIAAQLFDRRIAAWAAGILGVATFVPTYMFGVWPHMVALTFWLGATWLALCSQRAANMNASLGFLFASGLAIGAGLNIRIDLFLAAPVLFIWLRLFARPHDRLAPGFLLLGLAPGLLLSAYINLIKFGAFTPLSYGYEAGAGSISRYLPILVGGGAFLAAVWVINIPAAGARAVKHFGLSRVMVAFSLLSALALLVVGGFMGKALYGAYVLVLNLQDHNAYHQVGVERNEYGQLLFWGYPKKALIQSVPYLPLVFTPLYYFFRGKHIAEFSLCFLAVAAPISFYALSQWHGGGSYNMRYFMPALPFIAILSAWSITKFVDVSGGVKREQLLLFGFIAGAIYLLMQEAGQAAPALFAPAALYPQWLIAAGVMAGIVAFIARPASARIAKLALGAALLALGYAAAINISEEIGHEKTRAEQRAMARDISAPIPRGALIVTQSPLMFIPAERAGAFMMVPSEINMSDSVQTINAFAATGRCVYFHNSLSRNLVAPHLSSPVERAPIWASSKRFDGDPRLAFFTLSSQSAVCAF